MKLGRYTRELLDKHLLTELKEVARDLGVIPDGNKTRRETWIEALIGWPFPIFQALEPIENSSGVDRDEAASPIEIQALEPIAQTDIQSQEPIETGIDAEEVQEPIENSAGVDRLDAPVEFPDLESALAEIKRLRTANEELLARVRSQSATISRAKNISPVEKPSLKRVRDMASQAFLDVVKDVQYGFNLVWGQAKRHFRRLKDIWELLILDDWPLSDWFSPDRNEQPETPLPIFPPKRSRFGAIPFADDDLIDSYALGFAGVGSSCRSPPGGGDAMLQASTTCTCCIIIRFVVRSPSSLAIASYPLTTMNTPDTFTYRHSEMPPITDEQKAEIAEIDFSAANLILKFQGNYRALTELAETLADCLNTCEMNLQCIRIIPDGEAAPKAISVTDLPAIEKQIIVSTAITATVAIETLADVFNLDFDDTATLIRSKGQSRFDEVSSEELEDVLVQLVEGVKKNPKACIFRTEI